MVIPSLPARLDLPQLHKQATELQRGVRSGEPDVLRIAGLDRAQPSFSRPSAQLALARLYGFESWARLTRHVGAIAGRTWVFTPERGDEPAAERFLRRACVTYDAARDGDGSNAVHFLADHPDVPSQSLSAAAVCGDVAWIRRHLADRPGAVGARAAPYGWSPLMYAAYGRYPLDARTAVTVVRLLLDAGADPNDGRFFLGLPTPFTVLTGVFGGGESGPSPHPQVAAIARILLAAGADANDGQTLYNRMFTPADDFLEVLFEFGLARGDGGPWRRLLPDVLPPPQAVLDGLIEWAVTHDQRARIALLAANGVNLDRRGSDGLRPVGRARRAGRAQMAELLVELGVAPAGSDPVERFVVAALDGDAGVVRTVSPTVIAAASRTYPGLVVWAASLQRMTAVELLAEVGFDVNALARSDLMIEQPWQSALHTAVERDDVPLARRLLELGADPNLRDQRFDGTPLDWARHLHRPVLEALLAAVEHHLTQPERIEPGSTD